MTVRSLNQAGHAPSRRTSAFCRRKALISVYNAADRVCLRRVPPAAMTLRGQHKTLQNGHWGAPI